MESMGVVGEIMVQKWAEINRHVYRRRANPTFLPIHITGGIGDVLCSIELLKYFQDQKLAMVLYTPHGEALNYFSDLLDPIPLLKTLPEFDWHLEIDRMATFRMADSFSGFLLEQHRELFEKQKALFEYAPQCHAIGTKYRHESYLSAMLARDWKLRRRAFLGFSLNMERHPFVQWVDRRPPKSYLTVHDGYDVNSKVLVKGQRSTKQWHLEHWKRLIQLLKAKFPHLKIVQLGASTSRPIPGVDECLLGKTTINQAFDYLSESLLHIDGDSGLVHAAARMSVPCVVMFGPTPDYFYGYPKNTNLRSKVCEEACFHVKPDWMDQCPRGFDGPRCMDEISPEEVFNWASRHL